MARLLGRAAPVLALWGAVACSDGTLSIADESSDDTQAGPLVCDPPPAAQKPQASCDVTIELPPPPQGAEQHRPEGTQLSYCSNPPSSGAHYPIWADFKEYAAPVEAPYLVHSMEHGGVVLFYRCDPPGCPEIVEQLRKVVESVGDDPLCSPPTRNRIIITPSTTITTKVAAAAWGATYQAACADLPTLEAFVRDHYAKAPENVCFPGRSF